MQQNGPLFPLKNLLLILLLALVVLLIPALAMRFNAEVQWGFGDFLVAGLMLVAGGVAGDLLRRRAPQTTYRMAAGLTLAAVLALVWMNLAVGLIGPSDHPATFLYLAVLVVGLPGALGCRLRAPGLARTLRNMAVVQFLVPLVALLIWRPLLPVYAEAGGLLVALLLNLVFVLAFALAAFLFTRVD